MTEYTRFIPQIADYFGVSQQHVIEVFRNTEVFSSMIWAHTIVYVFILSILSALVISYYLRKQMGCSRSYDGELILFIAAVGGFVIIYSN
jgi:hypothetical protein